MTASRSTLIFGGAGFIGTNLAARLLEDPHNRLHIFDNLSRNGSQENLKWLRSLPAAEKRLQITIGDVRDSQGVAGAVAGADTVYHFAAQVAVTTSVADPRHDLEVNLLGTFNVLEAVRRCERPPFLLFTSTNKVYGELPHALLETHTHYRFAECEGIAEDQQLDFHSPYGCSKGAADQYVRDYARIYGIPAVVFRMSCIAGPHQFGNEDQGWVAHFVYSALSGRPITIYGNGKQVRDVLYVKDLVNAFLAARSHADITAGQIYNVGGGASNAVSLLEMLQLIKQISGRDIATTFATERPGDQKIYVTDCSKLTRHTGWKPQMNVTEALCNMHAWWHENQDALRSLTTSPLATASDGAAA